VYASRLFVSLLAIPPATCQNSATRSAPEQCRSHPDVHRAHRRYAVVSMRREERRLAAGCSRIDPRSTEKNRAEQSCTLTSCVVPRMDPHAYRTYGQLWVSKAGEARGQGREWKRTAPIIDARSLSVRREQAGRPAGGRHA
jgi:hypothetical protein